jgi:hypothetical protein
MCIIPGKNRLDAPKAGDCTVAFADLYPYSSQITSAYRRTRATAFAVFPFPINLQAHGQGSKGETLGVGATPIRRDFGLRRSVVSTSQSEDERPWALAGWHVRIRGSTCVLCRRYGRERYPAEYVPPLAHYTVAGLGSKVHGTARPWEHIPVT